MTSTIVGQDTAGRTDMENTKEWAKEEGKAEKARSGEIRQELKAKLRRKGASDGEAEDAMKLRDKGDRRGFHDAVGKIKEKGIEDTKKRGLTPDGPLQEEDGAGERILEGAKQAGSYVDAATGSLISRTEASVKERDKLNEEHDTTIDTMKEEIDSELARKMVRKGIPRAEAEAAIAAKNDGDDSKYKEVRRRMHRENREDTEQKKHGLDATGRTATYDGKDYVDDAVDNVKTGAKTSSDVLKKPFDMVAEHQEKKNLEKMSEMERENEIYGKLRRGGAGRTEARKAARDFSEGKPEAMIKLGREMRKRRAEKRAADVTKDLFGDKDGDTPKNEDGESDPNVLRDSEGREATDSNEAGKRDKFDDKGSPLEDMVKRINADRYSSTKGSMKLNEKQQKIQVASTSSDGKIADAKQQVNSATDEASATLDETKSEVVSQDQKDSWGSAVGDGLVEGIVAGATAFGAAMAEGVKNEIFGDNSEHSSEGEVQQGQTEPAGAGAAPGAVAAAPPAGGGGGGGSAPQVTGQSSSKSGKKSSSSSSKGKKSGSKKTKTAKSGGRPLCPECGQPMTFIGVEKGTKAHDWNVYECKRCKRTTYKGIARKKTASQPKQVSKPKPAPKPEPAPEPKGWKCPSCGSYDTVFKHSSALYGDVYHCNGCGGTVHNVD